MNRSPDDWLQQITPVLETLNQGVIINDENARIVFANAVFLEMLGLPAQEVVGRVVTDLFPPEGVPQLLRHIEQRKNAGRSRYEFYLPQPAGGRLPVLVTARQVSAPGGHAFSVVTATDITDQKRVETDLRHANTLLEARQHEIEEELLLAARVQQSLAPKTLTRGGVSIETFYQPVRSIGGDFGLVLPGKNTLDLLVCDVSGHGIGSALVANRIYTETLSHIERGTELGVMLHHLNHFVIQNLGCDSFYITLAAVRINSKEGSLQFAGGGHPPVMVVRGGESPRLLESQDPIIGLFENALQGQTCEIPVRSGDRVVLYTDGFTESFGAHREMLGVEGMAEIVQDTAPLPLAQMKQEILERVSKWRAGPAADDMSLVLAEVL
jgi:PAS domain S-box-containing protein